MLMLKKALLSAFFVVCAAGSSLALARCSVEGISAVVKVDKVVDGDTVRLSDGRSVRLIGVNTPEINYRTAAAEPYAKEARDRLSALIARQEVRLVLGQEPRDRYGRLLGYLSVSGSSLAEQLISEGLGWAVAIAPNTQLADCFFRVERNARRAGVGVWASGPIRAADLDRGGFALVRGRVSGIGRSAAHLYIELEGRLSLKLKPELLEAVWSEDAEMLKGREIEARGWIIDRSERLKSGSKYPPLLLSLTSRWHFEIL